MARALLSAGARPLLLVDADPVGGLCSALGEHALPTLAGVRAEVIGTARHGDDEAKRLVAEKLDYMVFAALTERDGYAILPMGRTTEKGCFCPANSLLRKAIDAVVDAFAVTVIDAEAGVEQINRQVTTRTTHAVVVTDGSTRSRDTLGLIAEMLGPDRVYAVANRALAVDGWQLPAGVRTAGRVPEDPCVRDRDARGLSLLDVPEDAPSAAAASEVVRALGLLPIGS
jgi:CO dehydrogenase maturation factor